MSTTDLDQSGGWRGRLALIALIIAGLAVVWFVAAALGVKFGFWGWQFGLLTMTVRLGQFFAIGALAISVLALIVALVKAPRKQPAMLALGAILVSGLLMGRLASLGAQGQALPRIHDIQTDWSDPVVASEKLLAARGADARQVRYGDEAVWDFGNDPELTGRLISEIQEEAEFDPEMDDDPDDKPYATIEPLIIESTPSEVFAAALDLVERRGWAVVTADAASGMIEATEETTWFGFKDDVAIRIRPAGEGKTRVDMRSISRVGISDLGANEKRVRFFLYDLAGQRFDG